MTDTTVTIAKVRLHCLTSPPQTFKKALTHTVTEKVQHISGYIKLTREKIQQD